MGRRVRHRDTYTIATAAEDASPPEGEYSVEGKSDGKEYSGAVTISKEGDDYKLNWKVANSTAIS